MTFVWRTVKWWLAIYVFVGSQLCDYIRIQYLVQVHGETLLKEQCSVKYFLGINCLFLFGYQAPRGFLSLVYYEPRKGIIQVIWCCWRKRLFPFHAFSYHAYLHCEPSSIALNFTTCLLLEPFISFRAFSCSAYFHSAHSPTALNVTRGCSLTLSISKRKWKRRGKKMQLLRDHVKEKSQSFRKFFMNIMKWQLKNTIEFFFLV
jgi:hypothetical protein